MSARERIQDLHLLISILPLTLSFGGKGPSVRAIVRLEKGCRELGLDSPTGRQIAEVGDELLECLEREEESARWEHYRDDL